MTKRFCGAPVPDGCGEPAYASLLCVAHYRRLLRARARGEPADLATPVRGQQAGRRVKVFTRVQESTAAALRAEGPVYAVAGEVLERWGSSRRTPARSKR